MTIALSGREPGSPRASDRHATDHDELALIFKEIDTDNSGYLDKDEVGALFKRLLGKQLTKIEIDEAMRYIDEDGSNAVGLEEFEKFWRREVEANMIAKGRVRLLLRLGSRYDACGINRPF